ncbi:MAG: hypothetical protein H7Y86_06890 [Rhizobacter sp.]|nr:hypothetical protein [Ferruginibacter sp.]
MCQLIEKIATDKGINVEDANYIFTFISDHLLSKIPALSRVIEDVFENADESILLEHVDKAIHLFSSSNGRRDLKTV